MNDPRIVPGIEQKMRPFLYRERGVRKGGRKGGKGITQSE